jgi:hypothetical protein
VHRFACAGQCVIVRAQLSLQEIDDCLKRVQRMERTIVNATVAEGAI